MKRPQYPSSAFQSPRRGKLARAAIIGSAAAATMAGLSTGCLDRPVAEQSPNTTNVFVQQIVVSKVDKIDLLFMVDNSISMADKQQILGMAVPKLVQRFIDPVCLDENDNVVVGATKTADGKCADNLKLEFEPINDIHIGVISSSIGGHGGTICSPASAPTNQPWETSEDDKGMLIAALLGPHNGAPLRTDPVTGQPLSGVGLNPLGFLEWTEGLIPQTTDFLNTFKTVVTATGENGCGYEASLEAWYRFLIDPDPPMEVAPPVGTGPVTPQGTNNLLLDQRASFLRPDSLVGIIMLSDENDCSVMDTGPSWLVTNIGEKVPRARAICDTDPNSECCRSCIDQGAPASCGDDPTCLTAFTDLEEPLNLRCYNQKRRFGIDFLQPISRYVDGLRSATVPDRNGNPVPNPLYSKIKDSQGVDHYPDLVPRVDSSLVYLAGIVGVPWQDISTEESRTDPEKLVYQKASEIDWDLILGNPSPENWADYKAPNDPFMIEQVPPRSGTNPVTGDSISPVTSPVPVALNAPTTTGNWINGHEYTDPLAEDLQFACIFPLAEPRDCAEFAGGCDCEMGDTDPVDSPLCQAPGTATNGGTQYFAKGYPGLRFLEVLRGYGENSVVASVCPKVATNEASAFFGYNPAVDAIVNRLKEALKGTCLPRALQIDPKTKRLACQVIEATQKRYGISCTGDRGKVEAGVEKAVKSALKDAGRCDGDALLKCDELTYCKLKEATGDAAENCQYDPADNPGGTGYCYIDATDPENLIGEPKIVENCPESERRLLRFISDAGEQPVPYDQSWVFVACLGAAVVER